MNILLEYPWLCVLGIGLPIFAVAMRFWWHVAQRSVWPRLLLCFTFACSIAPIPFSVNNGHSAAPTKVIPAMTLVVVGIGGWPDPFSFGLSFGGAISICVVTLIALAIWSV